MKEYRFKIYVGPLYVPVYAEGLSRNGWYDIVEGTEHIYASIMTDSQYNARCKAVGVKGIEHRDCFCIRENPVGTPEPAESCC